MTLRVGMFGFLLAFLGSGLLLGCATPGLAPPPEGGVLDQDPYVIGPADLLRISVWKNPELSVDVPVRPDGKISTPLLDDVQAAGLRPEELKEVVTRSLSEFVTNPDVTVVVLQVNSKQVSVLGAVARPAFLPVNRSLRVLDAIAISGGFTAFANKGDIKILRQRASGAAEYRFDYDAFVSGKAPESNILLKPGDTIVVPD